MIIIDNLHPLPNELRQHALSQEYEDWVGHDGVLYKRICRVEVPFIRKMLEDIFGSVDMLGMGYRLNFDDEVPNTAIHSDLGWGTHALVLYLSDNEESGTAFWKHKPSGTTRIDTGHTQLFDQVCSDWDDLSKWEMQQKVDMKFNRGIIYESALYHSRYPFQAFGDSVETGRLIVVAFFTPKGQS